MNQEIRGLDGSAQDRAQVERLLARYPNIGQGETQDLIRWFNESSALDVGMVASNEEIGEAYAQFRRQHVDRFKPKDIALAVVFAALCALVIAGIVYLGS